MHSNLAQKETSDLDWMIESIEYHLKYSIGKISKHHQPRDIYTALALTIREKLIDSMHTTESHYTNKKSKRVCYLSMEFLIGRLLENNLHNLGLYETAVTATEKFDLHLPTVLDSEYDPALGNGGLGRLAACFLDSIATLDISGYGYGINYEYGLFKQAFENGFQKEKPDHWMVHGTPWQLERPDEACIVPVYGRIQHDKDIHNNYNPMWVEWQVILGIPHDMPVVGYGDKTVNYLRLYSARSSDDFDINIFNQGDYIDAVGQKIASENISKVLYPSDSFEAGKELRLIQEYFLVACSVHDIVKRHIKDYSTLDNFYDKNVIQLNDTHPALTVVELMRKCIDEHDMSWDKAWGITQKSLAYTNHTLLPEALETWPVELIERVLPRHMQLIYEINHRFLHEVKHKAPELMPHMNNLSIIEEGHNKKVRMANLAIVGSFSVNGVAALHSELVKENLVPYFYQLWPHKFNNKTNGVTQRRWLLQANKGLANLITEHIGNDWIIQLDKLQHLNKLASNEDFKHAFMQVKQDNKIKLAEEIYKTTRIKVDPKSMFDIQAKRIHEYKRQMLSIMHIIHQYFSIIEDGHTLTVPRTYIFAGKAAPGYYVAKLYIKLINNMATIINNDERVKDQLKIVFIPDFKVSTAETIYPAADLSEQISTAGFEASGTGNMKFALNGALTIGTLDGANVEIREEVGEDNIFIFGLTSDKVKQLQTEGGYNPWDYYEQSSNTKRVIDALSSDTFCPDEPSLFMPLFDKLMYEGDFYLHLADFESYIHAQEQVATTFKQPSTWAKKAIINVANMGKFSSDRTIAQYANDIWGLTINY